MPSSSASCGKKLHDQPMIFQIGTGRVAPAITFALPFGDAQLPLHQFGQVIGGGFGGLNRQTMKEIGLAVFAGGLQTLQFGSSGSANCYCCKTMTSTLPASNAGEVIADAQEVAVGLAREGEPVHFRLFGRIGQRHRHPDD